MIQSQGSKPCYIVCYSFVFGCSFLFWCKLILEGGGWGWGVNESLNSQVRSGSAYLGFYKQIKPVSNMHTYTQGIGYANHNEWGIICISTFGQWKVNQVRWHYVLSKCRYSEVGFKERLFSFLMEGHTAPMKAQVDLELRVWSLLFDVYTVYGF